jgi:hypothetical protein
LRFLYQYLAHAARSCVVRCLAGVDRGGPLEVFILKLGIAMPNSPPRKFLCPRFRSPPILELKFFREIFIVLRSAHRFLYIRRHPLGYEPGVRWIVGTSCRSVVRDLKARCNAAASAGLLLLYKNPRCRGSRSGVEVQVGDARKRRRKEWTSAITP